MKDKHSIYQFFSSIPWAIQYIDKKEQNIDNQTFIGEYY